MAFLYKNSAPVPFFLSFKRIGYYCISFDINRLQQRKQKSPILHHSASRVLISCPNSIKTWLVMNCRLADFEWKRLTEDSESLKLSSYFHTRVTVSFHNPFPNCLKPLYQSETRCAPLIVLKIDFMYS